MAKSKVTVCYWVGTMRREGHANSYRGAMRIAARNRNAWGPNFYSADGERLYDDGNGLVRESTIGSDVMVYEV